jgi:hypothetical protein
MNAIETPKLRASLRVALNATFVEISASRNPLSGNIGTETAIAGRNANTQSGTMIFMTEIIPKSIFRRAVLPAASSLTLKMGDIQASCI